MPIPSGPGAGGAGGPAAELSSIDAQLLSCAATVTTLSAKLLTARAEASELYARRAEVVRACVAAGVRAGPPPVVEGVDTSGAVNGSGFMDSARAGLNVLSWSNGFIVPTTPPGGGGMMPGGWGLGDPMQNMQGQFPAQLSPVFSRHGVAALPGGAPTSKATLSPGVWNRVTVCHTENGLFWVHEEQQSERLSETEMAMAAVYGKDETPAAVSDDMITPGAWFAAPYVHPDAEASDEPMWTRAVVDRMLDDGSVAITHVDYGSNAVLMPSELRLLTTEFLALPAQAIKCQLNGTQAYTGAGRAALAEVFTELLDWQSFFCALVTPPVGDGPCGVNLYDETAVDLLLKVEEHMASHDVGDNEGSESAITPQGSDNTDAAAARPAADSQPPVVQKQQGPAWGGTKNPSVLAPPPPAAPANRDGWVEVGKKAPTKTKTKPPPTGAGGAPQRAPGDRQAGPHGFVFHCSSSTLNECLSLQLFGLPRKFFEMMQKNIKPAIDGEASPTVLFLFNIQKGELYGPFVATSETGQDIDPEAWKAAMKKTSQRGSPFPAQVRVRWRNGEKKPVKVPKINIGPVNPSNVQQFIDKLGA